MRRATWESSAGALAALLNGAANTQLAMYDLFTITTPAGLTLRYTSAETSLTVNGVTYTAGPIIRRSRTRLTVGIEVDTLDLNIAADASVTVNGVPIIQFIAGNGLNGARVLLERAFSPGPGQAITGTLPLFSGRVSDTPAITRAEARVTVKSDSEILNVKLPRNIYQAPCLNTLFDSACGLVRASWTASGTAQSATDAQRLYFTHALAAAAGMYDLGVCTFTSGGNAGVSRTVRSYQTVAGSGVNRITLMSPLPVAVANGDAFTIYAGCDKKQSTCSGKFSNLARFRGTPYIPTAESIV